MGVVQRNGKMVNEKDLETKKKPGFKARTGHCGANKRSGGTCSKAAGWGTSHPGIGKCKLHGGSLPNHVKAAAKEEYRKLLGNPIEVNPFEAIMHCIAIRAGEIKWLSERMAELDKKDWTEDTMLGKQFHLYVRERSAAMKDQVRFCQIAIGMGIAERYVKMAEMYGETFAFYTKGLLDDLWPFLSMEGRAKAPEFVRQRLLTLDEAQTSIEMLALPAAEAIEA